jgi:hypothetical protein
MDCVFFLPSGAAKDVGATLTKMVIRHRSIEQKLRVLSG